MFIIEVEVLAKRFDYDKEQIRVWFSHKKVTIFENDEVVIYNFENPLYEKGLNKY